MNVKELVKQTQENLEQYNLSQACITAVLNGVFEAITIGLQNDGKVSISGFGNFEVRDTAARSARNPATGETIEVPAGKRVVFRPSTVLKDSVK